MFLHENYVVQNINILHEFLYTRNTSVQNSHHKQPPQKFLSHPDTFSTQFSTHKRKSPIYISMKQSRNPIKFDGPTRNCTEFNH